MGIVRTGWRVLCDAVKTFFRKDGLDLAASVSFYSVLSAFPFLFLAIYIVGAVLGASEEFVRGVTMLLKQIRPHLADFFLEELRNITTHSSSLGWFGFGFLLWTATLVFHSLERAFGEMFETRKGRHFIHSVFCSLIMIPIMGSLLFGAVVIIAILKAMRQFQVEIVGGSLVTTSILEMGIGHIVPILLVIVSFTTLYKFVPAAKVPFKHALLGGVVGTVLWETAMRIFISYALTTETYGTVFGSFKTAFVILLAFYYSACVLLFCGAIVAQCGQIRR